MTVTAQYTINSYTVTFNTNGGTPVVAKTVNYGSKVAKPTPDPTKVGFTFDGWYSNSALTSRYDFNTAVASSFTLYAKWTPKPVGVRVLTDGNTYFINSAVTGKPMEIGGGRTDNGAGVNQYNLNNTLAQQWRVSYDSDDYATFVNVNSGKVLDVAGGIAACGSRVQQYDSNGSDAQKWKVEQSGDQFIIKSKVNENFVLDLSGASSADGAQIWLYESNNSQAQRWVFYDITAKSAEVVSNASNNSSVVSAGTYLIYSNVASERSLDVAGGSMSSGANVQSYQTNYSNAQKWRVDFVDNFARITNVGSGKVLDISCGSTAPGANVQQYEWNGSMAQRWVFLTNGNGSIKIQSALFPNLVLDIAGGSGALGANVQVYTDNGSAAQQWAFAAV